MAPGRLRLQGSGLVGVFPEVTVYDAMGAMDRVAFRPQYLHLPARYLDQVDHGKVADDPCICCGNTQNIKAARDGGLRRRIRRPFRAQVTALRLDIEDLSRQTEARSATGTTRTGRPAGDAAASGPGGREVEVLGGRGVWPCFGPFSTLCIGGNGTSPPPTAPARQAQRGLKNRPNRVALLELRGQLVRETWPRPGVLPEPADPAGTRRAGDVKEVRRTGAAGWACRAAHEHCRNGAELHMVRQRKRQAERIVVRMTPEDRDLILSLPLANSDHARRLRSVPGKDYLLGGYTMDDLDDLCGYIAAEANHTDDEDLEERLDDLLDRLEEVQKLHRSGMWEANES